MSDLEIRVEAKPPIEQALASDLPNERCPLVVINPGTHDAMTVVVLQDSPDTYYEQTEKAAPNYAPAVKSARKILLLEGDPENESLVRGLVGRSESKVAVYVPGTRDMEDTLKQKYTARDLDTDLREQDRAGKERLAQKLKARQDQAHNLTAGVKPNGRYYFAR